MQNIPWTTQELAQLDICIKKQLPWWEIAPLIPTRSVIAIRKKLQRYNKQTYTPVKKMAPAEVEQTDLKEISSIQSKYLEVSKWNTVGTVNATKKILCLSDIHFPFAHEPFLKKAVDDNLDADIVVLNGDILDGYIFSRFEKDKTVAAIDEYMCALSFVSKLSEIFPRVVLVGGNHDVRVSSSLKHAGYPPDAIRILRPDVISRIANGEVLDKNGNLVKKLNFKNVYYPPTEPWWVQIGKTLFIHPHSRGSAKPGWTVSTWAKKFHDRLPASSFDSIVCGHTHAQYKGIIGSTLLIEQGCLCSYMPYSWQPREVMGSNAMSGYATIYQDDKGNTNFNKSNFIYLGQLLPINKPLYTGEIHE